MFALKLFALDPSIEPFRLPVTPFQRKINTMSDSEDIGTEYTVVNHDYVKLSKRVEIKKQERVNPFVVAVTLTETLYPAHMRTSSPGDVCVLNVPSASWCDLAMSKQYQLILVEVDESRNDHMYIQRNDDDDDEDGFEENVEDAQSEAPYDSVLDEATYSTMLEETAGKAEGTAGNSILDEATYDRLLDDKIPF